MNLIQLRTLRTLAVALAVALAGSLLAPSILGALPVPAPPHTLKELAARRQALAAACPDGIAILPSSWELKSYSEDGFRQDADFYYFTGIERQIGAVLALDVPSNESILFVPDQSPAVQFFGATHDTGESSARRLGLSQVLPLDRFVPFLDSRLGATEELRLCLGGGETAVAVAPSIPGLEPFGDPRAVLLQALSARWPGTSFDDLGERIAQLRARKSVSEQALARVAGRAAVAALIVGLESVGPEKSQRSVEAAIAAACFNNGADGVSWWPWAQSGPNAVFPRTFSSFADYRHLDRTMHDGELVRLDIGCQYSHYNSDVGRTAPVSGRWSTAQRETWDLLITAYRAGLTAVRDGASINDVREAFEGGVRTTVDDLESETAREAASILLDRERNPFWQIHGVGLAPAEPIGPVLREGMIVAFEPIFDVAGEGYFLEDLLLVTRDGYELLTPHLPYTAREIEEAMGATTTRSPPRAPSSPPP